MTETKRKIKLQMLSFQGEGEIGDAFYKWVKFDQNLKTAEFLALGLCDLVKLC